MPTSASAAATAGWASSCASHFLMLLGGLLTSLVRMAAQKTRSPRPGASPLRYAVCDYQGRMLVSRHKNGEQKTPRQTWPSVALASFRMLFWLRAEPVSSSARSTQLSV